MGKAPKAGKPKGRRPGESTPLGQTSGRKPRGGKKSGSESPWDCFDPLGNHANCLVRRGQPRWG